MISWKSALVSHTPGWPHSVCANHTRSDLEYLISLDTHTRVLLHVSLQWVVNLLVVWKTWCLLLDRRTVSFSLTFC